MKPSFILKKEELLTRSNFAQKNSWERSHVDRKSGSVRDNEMDGSGKGQIQTLGQCFPARDLYVSPYLLPKPCT
ncbi:unnamed protein product [Sphenostylis stenocarpa]|uniref:Uncharacterized protein n=1 Tax=Sphenostylis stenocarpa TaxID=92480 RepID=A0AA86S9Q6_9FABA|nr:unnamed protein product [Sphenostylis stenocarpa]